MSTIAELLVQTTATLFASGPAPDGSVWTREQAAEQARAIVAAIYGEPCDDPDVCPKDDGREPHNKTGGDTCINCGWPRSQHGAPR